MRTINTTQLKWLLLMKKMGKFYNRFGSRERVMKSFKINLDFFQLLITPVHCACSIGTSTIIICDRVGTE